MLYLHLYSIHTPQFFLQKNSKKSEQLNKKSYLCSTFEKIQNLMNEHVSYIIPYAGLKAGIHTFEFLAETPFFQAFEDGLITEGAVKATMTLDRKPEMMVFDFVFEGDVILPCDRCLDDYTQKISGEAQYIVKFADREYEEDEILYITTTEGNLNVAHFLYESIVLELPTRRVHEEGKCNEAVASLIIGESILDPNAAPDMPTDDADNPFAQALKGFNAN
jgi:uncharacterized protein